jgi:serine/threonine protein kinase
MGRTDAPSEPLIAGRYRLSQRLGQGGMGDVWSAIHVVTRRQVALKFLRGQLAGRPEMRQRLLREARAATAVEHPNVVEVLDVFELEDGLPVMVMALLEGETLTALLARSAPLSLDAALEVLLPVVSAVGTAHARGVVHRDLKPENVFLARDSTKTVVKVLDFGIAKLMSEDGSGEGVTLTGTGAALGTPCYMAPEQGFGEHEIDHRADIWSLGAMFYESLTGGRPVEGDSLGQVIKRFLIQGITPIDVLAPDLPHDVSRLVMRMLSRERETRPEDLREVHEVLSRHARGVVPSFGPPAALAVGGVSSVRPSRPSLLVPPHRSAPLVSEGRRRFRALWLTGAIAFLLVLLIGLGAHSSSDGAARKPLTVTIASAIQSPAAVPLPGAPVTAPSPQPVVAVVPARQPAQRPIRAGTKASMTPNARSVPARSAAPTPAAASAAVVPSFAGIFEQPPF